MKIIVMLRNFESLEQCSVWRGLAAESGEVDYVCLGDFFQGVAGSAPGGEAADDDEGVETILAEEVRDSGAGGFAAAGAVEGHVFVSGEMFYFVAEIIGLDANRAGAVVSVAAHVRQQDFCSSFRFEFRRQLRDLDARHDAIAAMLPVQ